MAASKLQSDCVGNWGSLTTGLTPADDKATSELRSERISGRLRLLLLLPAVLREPAEQRLEL